MRENMGLYRGRIIKSNQWVKGNLLVWKNGNCSILVNDLESNTKLPMQVDPETVGQFTGFYDKNGEKIFEGDILSARYDEKHLEDVTISVVEWDKNKWMIRQGEYEPDELSEWDEKYQTIVANIHDNPEFLKEGV